MCVTIALDMRNAFNSVSRQRMLEGLRKRSKFKKIDGGVPQRSVFGPMLSNMYDGLLELGMPQEAKLVGFTDNLLVVVVAKRD